MTNEEKLSIATKYLGDRHLLANKVVRLDRAQPKPQWVPAYLLKTDQKGNG